MFRSSRSFTLPLSFFLGLATVAGCAAATGDDPSGSQASNEALNLPIPVREIPLPWIAPPTALASTTSPQVCAAHTPSPFFSGLACEAAIEDENLLLVWSWSDTGSPAGYIDEGTPTGYKVYASFNGSAYTLWATQSSGSGYTEDGVVAPTGISSCFQVSAYKGSWESARSNTVCTSGVGNPVKTTVLAPQVEQTFEEESDNGDTFTLGPIATPPNQVNVSYGYEYYNVVTTTNWDWFNTEAGLFFNTSSLAGHTILTATLQLDPKGSPSCLDAVSLSSQEWVDQTFDNTVPIPGTQIATGLYGSAGPTISVDVTNTVRGWLAGDTNLGLLLTGKYTGDLEGNGSYISTSCAATYGDAQVTVTYL